MKEEPQISKISSKSSYYKCNHSYGFRAGEKAEIIGVRTITLFSMEGTPCFVVLYPDGFIDYVPLGKNPGNYDIS